jgi:hypothetical protein
MASTSKAAALQFEREEPVGRAEIQHAQAGAVVRQRERFQNRGRVMVPGCHEAGPDLDAVGTLRMAAIIARASASSTPCS